MSVTDRTQRTRVLDPQRSFIIQAPAGSGKTELLTQRFLRLLGCVELPEQVLAITFTRKATQEMRERILLRLRQAAGQVEPNAEFERVAVRLAAAVLRRDRSHGWDLCLNPGRLQVYTIDGLCARIASRSPQVGHGAAGLAVVEDARPLYREAARRLIEDAGRPGTFESAHPALSRVLGHVNCNTQQLHRLLADMLSHRDQWLKRMGVRYPDMQRILAMQQEIEMSGLAAALGSKRIAALVHELSLLAEHADDSDKAGKFLAAQERSRLDPGNADMRIRALLAALKLVSSSKNEPYTPRAAARYVLPGSGVDRAGRIAAIRSILGRWHEDEPAVQAFRRFVAAPPLDDQTGARRLLEDFQTLLKAATAELAVLFMETGKSDFQNLADLAMQALGEDHGPGAALLIEDRRLAHILMDEFQDTSHTQLQLLRRLVSGWQCGDGRTLFLVGDPMQSIYRFREADVKLFKQVCEERRLGDVSLEPVRLTANFRSREELIGWINAQFPRVFGSPAGQAYGAVPYEPVQARRGTGGLLSINPWPAEAGDEYEAQQVAELAASRLAAAPDSEIAVLVRKRSQLESIARALQRKGLPFSAVQAEHLGRRPVVLDLLSFTRAILNPADRVAWLALLRAPWCALSPDELHVAAGEERTVDILARLGQPETLASLPGEKADRVQKLHQVMHAVRARHGQVPLHRLVEIAWLACGGAFSVGSGVELENAQDFLELLAGLEAEAHDDLLEALAECLDTLYAGSVASQIQLMTIHRAKGLEFDVVILPGLHKRPRQGDAPLLRLAELRVEGLDGVLMAPLRKTGQDGASLYEYLGRLDAEEERCEAQRVLYVAATRARRELHLFGAWTLKGSGDKRKPGCNRGTFMDMLWPCFEPRIDPGAAREEAVGAAPAVPLLPQLRLRGEPALRAPLPAAPEQAAPAEMRLPNRDDVALGEALHLWLQLMHDHWSDQWTPGWFLEHEPALASSLSRAGAQEESLAGLSVALRSMICAILGSRHGLALVSPEGKAGSWAELAMCRREGMRLKRYVLDRLYGTGEGRYVIVDYKTGAPGARAEESWRRQLAGYARLIESATEGVIEESVIARVSGDRCELIAL